LVEGLGVLERLAAAETFDRLIGRTPLQADWDGAARDRVGQLAYAGDRLRRER
jgi:hypothetical protein